MLICLWVAAVIYRSQMSVSSGSQRSEENHNRWPLEMFWLIFNRLRGGKHLWHLFNMTPAYVASFGALHLCCTWLLRFHFLYFIQDIFSILFEITVYSAIVILPLSLLLRVKALKISLKMCCRASEPWQDRLQLQCCGFLWNPDADRRGCVAFFPALVWCDAWMQMEFDSCHLLNRNQRLRPLFFFSLCEILKYNAGRNEPGWETKLIPVAVVWLHSGLYSCLLTFVASVWVRVLVPSSRCIPMWGQRFQLTAVHFALCLLKVKGVSVRPLDKL